MEEFSDTRQIFSGSFRRPESPCVFEITRQLTAADIFVRQSTMVGAKTPAVKSLRATHHKLAQCLASGMSDAEASLATGYSSSRISILKIDPSFQELMSFYSETRKDVFINVMERMAGFATDAVEVLQERLAEKPEAFSNKDLNDLIKTTADRGGHSPVQKTENKTIIISAEDLKKMKQEVENTQNGQVRKIHQVEEVSRFKDRQKSQEDKEPLILHNDNRPSGDSEEQAKASGLAGEGDNL
jgi:hypothetical protein